MATYHLSVPLQKEKIAALEIGDVVYLTGNVFTMRDMAHLRVRELLQTGAPLPKDFAGSAVFHAGPVAHQADGGRWVLDVIGPTTSIRMEPYAEMVGELGIRALIGKGGMAEDTVACCQKYGYVYFQAAPGCAAKLAEAVEAIRDVTWLDLGMPEALWDFTATDFGPLVVAIDTKGNSIYKNVRERACTVLDRLYPAV